MKETPEKKVLCPIRTTSDGWHVLRCHYSVVPHYDFQAACKGLSEEGIARELEISWNSVSGKRVYPEFRHEMHVALEPLRWDGSTLYIGLDFGGCPACVPSFINQWGQWCLLPPLAPLEDLHIGTYEFGEMIADLLSREYAYPRGLALNELKLKFFGDPAGQMRPQKTRSSEGAELRSAFEILNKGIEFPAGRAPDGSQLMIKKPGWGWRVQPGDVSNEKRQAAVKNRLNTLVSGLPAMLVDPRANVLIEGFGGMYRYPDRANGGYGEYPEKNWWSHAMDSCAYTATRLFYIPSEDEEEDARVYHQPVVSRAAGRRGY